MLNIQKGGSRDWRAGRQVKELEKGGNYVERKGKQNKSDKSFIHSLT